MIVGLFRSGSGLVAALKLNFSAGRYELPSLRNFVSTLNEKWLSMIASHYPVTNQHLFEQKSNHDKRLRTNEYIFILLPFQKLQHSSLILFHPLTAMDPLSLAASTAGTINLMQLVLSHLGPLRGKGTTLGTFETRAREVLQEFGSLFSLFYAEQASNIDAPYSDAVGISKYIL
jgi:hypothetical protein